MRDRPAPPPVRPGRAFFARAPAALARALIGQHLVRILDDGASLGGPPLRGGSPPRRLAGVIVETEAYLGGPDRCSHSFALRRTPRNEAMYAPPGTCYVYFTYGMHFCMNIVCGREDEPVAVLLRALEPTEGHDAMLANRLAARAASGAAPPSRAAPARHALARGPGNLCKALGIDRRFNGVDLVTSPRLFIEIGRTAQHPKGTLGNTPRIGVGDASPWAARPLRWFVAGNPSVSPPRRVNQPG